MADNANDWSLSRVVRVYRPKGEESWFPVDPKKNRVTRNRFVDGVRCEIVYVFRTIDGFAHWNLNGRALKPRELIRLERARSRNARVRVANIDVDPCKMTTLDGQVVFRELLSVNDEPKLELRRCFAEPNETVQLVARSHRKRLRSEFVECEPEVVIQPVSEDEVSFRSFSDTLDVVIKEEPVDPSEISEIQPILPPATPEISIPTGVRRSRRLRTEEQSRKYVEHDPRRKKTRRR